MFTTKETYAQALEEYKQLETIEKQWVQMLSETEIRREGGSFILRKKDAPWVKMCCDLRELDDIIAALEKLRYA